MKNWSVTMFLLSLLSPVVVDAEDIYRSTRSLEEQQAISQIGQAEYYARMALRSLEASEKIGKAPYFNYQSAREDIEKILAEFKTYLKGDESTELPKAVPLIVDGRYFGESIQRFLSTQTTEERQGVNNLPKKGDEPPRVVSKTAVKTSAPKSKKDTAEEKPRVQQQNSTMALPAPALRSPNGKSTRDKIDEILKKGL
jgi:hypothetical protein